MTMTHREAVRVEQHTRDMYQRGEQLLLHIQSIQRGIAGMSRRVFTLGFFPCDMPWSWFQALPSTAVLRESHGENKENKKTKEDPCRIPAFTLTSLIVSLSCLAKHKSGEKTY